MDILEAVPNISCGADTGALARILVDVTNALGPNVRLLHVDTNANANRTVLTLAGNSADVVDACFALFNSCSAHIDMRTHRGTHPRLGAVDVCPFIPVKKVRTPDLLRFIDGFAQRVANELHIPVYMYEKSAHYPKRENLAFIRRGEYESLPEKLKKFPPDYGPQEFTQQVARTGASVIGVRNFLIAFNMSLNTKDVLVAKQIAAHLRAANGGLPAVKAIGWYMANYHCAQVSCNLTDFHQTTLAVLFETCKRAAAAYGLTVTAGELIGLIPQAALIEAGQFYAPHEKNEAALIHAAVENLKLSVITPFDPNKRILERLL